MSGLYNMIFGYSDQAPVALGLIGKTSDDFMRFRDAWLEKGPDGTVRIAVYTRMGGGNRDHGDWGTCDLTGEQGYGDGPCWGCWVDSVATWPGYLGGVDDEFDNTYRTFYFQVPEEWSERVAALDVQDTVDTGARWAQLAESLKASTAGSDQ